MLEQHPFASMLVEQLPKIERICLFVCRRYSLGGEEVADFTSWVKLKLVEDDYAVMRKFRRESAVATYLTVVIAMLLRDYRVQRWGRWRPSAAALRAGALAVRLETLVRRDGMRLDEVGELLRTAGETTLSDRELARLLADLPFRSPLRPMEAGPELLEQAPSASAADELVVSGEAAAERGATERAIAAALEQMPPEEQVILRMRFWEGATVADISRALGIPQKPLYRRLERALAELRRKLEREGVSRERASELLGEPAA